MTLLDKIAEIEDAYEKNKRLLLIDFDLMQDIKGLCTTLKECIETLKWYADENNWALDATSNRKRRIEPARECLKKIGVE